MIIIKRRDAIFDENYRVHTLVITILLFFILYMLDDLFNACYLTPVVVSVLLLTWQMVSKARFKCRATHVLSQFDKLRL